MNYLSAVEWCFLDVRAGMSRVAWDVAGAMRDRGHNVAMVCTQRNAEGGAEPLSESEGIRILRYERPVLPAWHPRRGTATIKAAAKATSRWLGGETWNIVHMHSPFTGLGVKRSLGMGPRYVYTVHSPVVTEQQLNWARQGIPGRLKLMFGLGQLKRMEAELVGKSAAVQGLSEYTKSQMGEFHDLADRVTVIPHWRRPELVRRHSKAEARKMLGLPERERILFTARIHGPRYGLDIAIRAIAPQVEAGRCLFCMGGDGPLRSSLEALARELHQGDGILFPGMLDDEGMALWYEAADLFVLPTTALECFGLITMEAFAHGCPVLSTDAAAVPESMRPIMPDFIVPAGDEDALRRKVDDFLAGRLVPPTPEKLVAYVNERFDKSVVVPKLAKLLEG